jgi:hypothetical protein
MKKARGRHALWVVSDAESYQSCHQARGLLASSPVR